MGHTYHIHPQSVLPIPTPSPPRIRCRSWAVLGVAGLVAASCAEEPRRRPAPQVRCEQTRRVVENGTVEARERASYSAIVERCVEWRTYNDVGQ